MLPTDTVTSSAKLLQKQHPNPLMVNCYSEGGAVDYVEVSLGKTQNCALPTDASTSDDA